MTDDQFLQYQQETEAFCECFSLSFCYLFTYKTKQERDAAILLFELLGVKPDKVFEAFTNLYAYRFTIQRKVRGTRSGLFTPKAYNAQP